MTKKLKIVSSIILIVTGILVALSITTQKLIRVCDYIDNTTDDDF